MVCFSPLKQLHTLHFSIALSRIGQARQVRLWVLSKCIAVGRGVIMLLWCCRERWAMTCVCQQSIRYSDVALDACCMREVYMWREWVQTRTLLFIVWPTKKHGGWQLHKLSSELFCTSVVHRTNYDWPIHVQNMSSRHVHCKWSAAETQRLSDINSCVYDFIAFD